MELIAIIFAVTIILILGGGGYYMFKGQASKLDQLNVKLNDFKKSDQFEKLNTHLNSLSSQLDNSINETNRLWIDSIKNEEDENRKLELLEAATKRFPSEKIFIEDLRKILHPLATEGDNLLVRREALMRLREHATRFMDNCKVEDFDYALDFRNNVISSMESVVKKIDDLRKSNFDKYITALESKISELKKKPDDEKLLEEIENIDERIDQNVLLNYPTILSKYEELSKSLIQNLNKNEKESKAELRNYNEKVLKDAKKAQKLIQKHSSGGFFDSSNAVNYNERKHLTKLVKLILHNTNQLHPSTSHYLRMVEAEIFNKLESKGKILLTELMIKETYK